MAEYIVAASALTAALFVNIPGQDQSAFTLMINALKTAWSSYFYAIAMPL